MKKLFLGLIFVCLFLVGCGEPYGVIDNAKVVKVEKDDYNRKYVTIEKNEEQLRLELYNHDYKALVEGQTVNIEFNSVYHVTKLEFPKLEGYVDNNKE